MNYWIVPSNIKLFDVESCIRDHQIVYWNQKNYKYKVGDIVFIYCSGTIGKIRYATRVEEVDLSYDESIMDFERKYWKNGSGSEAKVILLRLLQSFDSEPLGRKELLKNGLSGNIQSPIRVKEELLDYIKLFLDKEIVSKYIIKTENMAMKDSNLVFKHRVDLSFLKYGFVLSKYEINDNLSYLESAVSENAQIKVFFEGKEYFAYFDFPSSSKRYRFMFKTPIKEAFKEKFIECYKIENGEIVTQSEIVVNVGFYATSDKYTFEAKQIGNMISVDIDNVKAQYQSYLDEQKEAYTGYAKSIEKKFVKDKAKELFGLPSAYYITSPDDVELLVEEIRKDPDTNEKDKRAGSRNPSCSLKVFAKFLESIYGVSDSKIEDPKLPELPLPEQIIYYGTPGCGKSHYVNKYIKEKTKDIDFKALGLKEKENVLRITFHPDTDYASFVGTFKPLMVGEKGNRKIEYDFMPQVFADAYVFAYKHPQVPVFLIIEEINRGNCAQIFGDLFQLLDRDEETGISEYPIKANADLKNYLQNKLGEDNEGIKNGEISLPRNLNIIATMNTSDQSLFPMDSAFKRRWSWKYMKIDYENEESAEYQIEINADHSYLWNEFLKSVNKHIYELTKSEDKQLGNFFIKGTIDIDTFISKVMFYLWSEICKEEVGNKRSFYFTKHRYDKDLPKDQDKWDFKFSDLFDDEAEKILIGFMEYLGVKNLSE